MALLLCKQFRKPNLNYFCTLIYLANTYLLCFSSKQEHKLSEWNGLPAFWEHKVWRWVKSQYNSIYLWVIERFYNHWEYLFCFSKFILFLYLHFILCFSKWHWGRWKKKINPSIYKSICAEILRHKLQNIVKYKNETSVNVWSTSYNTELYLIAFFHKTC